MTAEIAAESGGDVDLLRRARIAIVSGDSD
jgi:hypothetical protein